MDMPETPVRPKPEVLTALVNSVGLIAVLGLFAVTLIIGLIMILAGTTIFLLWAVVNKPWGR